jgi:hypothetical protein
MADVTKLPKRKKRRSRKTHDAQVYFPHWPQNMRSDPKRVLMSAIAEDPQEVVVIGRAKEGGDYTYFIDSSSTDDREMLWLIEKAKKCLI